MHRLLALVDHRRCVEEEEDRRTAILVTKVVRRGSVHGEIAGLDTCRIHRVANVDFEVSRLGVHHAAASRVSGGDSKTNQIPVGKGILLRLAVDGYSPVRPRSDMLGGYRGAVVV